MNCTLENVNVPTNSSDEKHDILWCGDPFAVYDGRAEVVSVGPSKWKLYEHCFHFVVKSIWTRESHDGCGSWCLTEGGKCIV